MLHANGSTQYCHDRFGQVTRKVQTVNGVASTLRYAYSKSGRLTALTYPDGSVADYVRDPQGHISQIGLTRPGQARQIVVNNVTYAAFGPATGWTYGNGASCSVRWIWITARRRCMTRGRRPVAGLWL